MSIIIFRPSMCLTILPILLSALVLGCSRGFFLPRPGPGSFPGTENGNDTDAIVIENTDGDNSTLPPYIIGDNSTLPPYNDGDNSTLPPYNSPLPLQVHAQKSGPVVTVVQEHVNFKILPQRANTYDVFVTQNATRSSTTAVQIMRDIVRRLGPTGARGTWSKDGVVVCLWGRTLVFG